MTTKPKKPSRADLARKIVELESMLAFRAAFAFREVEKAGNQLMASAAIISIIAPGGRVIVAPTAICNGLSEESIRALKADFARSFNVATEIKPV